jgi:type IV secretory pathway VirJ component
MRKIILLLCILIAILKSEAIPADTLVYRTFGKVVIYHPERTPDSFVIFISGDGGWNKAVMDMAGNVVSQAAMVLGINIVEYLKRSKSSKSKCLYPAADLEDISMTIQKKYKFRQYLKPILVGYSSGATLAYGALAQAPANTFKGIITLGFCPDLEIDRPMCKGTGLNSHVLKGSKSYYLEPCLTLTSPFIALNGEDDQVCTCTNTKKFMEPIPFSELTILPKVGHGFAVSKNWLPQFATAFQKIMRELDFAEKKSAENKLLQAQCDSLLASDLPLTIMPSAIKNELPLAIFISGDGGWTSFDQSLNEKLTEKGIPVLGLDAQKYFWNERKPMAVAEELTVAIKHYMNLWNRNSFIFIGYSFGADVAPFIANSFSSELKETLKGVYCFSPDASGDFEIHITDMLNFSSREKYDVLSELKQIKPMNPVCIFGSDEDAEFQSILSKAAIKTEILPGSHHYNNDFEAISTLILKDLKP